MPENALAGGEEDIGGNEPADFGVIVPALEVVETCLGFVLLCTPWRGCPLRDCAFSDSCLLKQNVVYQQASPPGYHGACQEHS